MCVQALGGDLKTPWLSFSDQSALEVSVTQDALYKSASYLYYLTFNTRCSVFTVSGEPANE